MQTDDSSARSDRGPVRPGPRFMKWLAESKDVLMAAGMVVFLAWLGQHVVGARLGDSAAAQTFTMWALAGIAIGAFVGFLFGIPRVLQDDARTPAQDAPRPEERSSRSRATPRYALRVNTNLEQISDWLTKILVGLGLIELSKVPGHVDRASRALAHALAPVTRAGGVAPVEPPDAVALAAAVILYFPVVGFLGGYLMTRLFLSEAFSRADQRAQSTIPVGGADLEPAEVVSQQQSVLADLQREVARLGAAPTAGRGPELAPEAPARPPAAPAARSALADAERDVPPFVRGDTPATEARGGSPSAAVPPFAPPPPPPPSAPRAQPHRAPPANVAQRRRSLLWVDDKPRGNATQMELLRQQGFDIEMALSTREATNLLDQGRRYDAVITDWVREEEGRRVNEAGLELLRELAKRGIGPAFVYAGRSVTSPAVQAAAYAAGAKLVTASGTELLSALLALL